MLYMASAIRELLNSHIVRMPNPKLQNSHKLTLPPKCYRTPLTAPLYTQYTEFSVTASAALRLQNAGILHLSTPRLQNCPKLPLEHSGCRTPTNHESVHSAYRALVNCFSLLPGYSSPIQCVSYTSVTELQYSAWPNPKPQNYR